MLTPEKKTKPTKKCVQKGRALTQKTKSTRLPAVVDRYLQRVSVGDHVFRSKYTSLCNQGVTSLPRCSTIAVFYCMDARERSGRGYGLGRNFSPQHG